MIKVTPDRIKEVFDQIDQQMGKQSVLKKTLIFMDITFERIFYKNFKEDYFQYGFYYKNRDGRNQFFTSGRKKNFIKTVNSHENRKYFDKKELFVDKFRDYIGRDALNLDNATFEEFKAFADKHNKMFVKPSAGFFGLGARVEECGDEESQKELYERLRKESVLLEEILSQNEAMASFNDSSVNTIRIITFVHNNGEATVIPAAALRVGRKGRVADNFHHQGIAALIDVDTGYITTSGVGKDGKHWVVHPDSNRPFVGFQIPMWDEICECVKKAALVCPEVRYVGWDVALTADNRIVLIEGNSKADPDLIQMTDGIGKWPLFKACMDEVLEAK